MYFNIIYFYKIYLLLIVYIIKLQLHKYNEYDNVLCRLLLLILLLVIYF